MSTQAQNTLGIYPNPGTGSLRVSGWQATDGAARVQVRNMQGQVVHTQALTQAQFSLTHLPAGAYIVEIQTPTQWHQERYLHMPTI